jgi:hypothetical protein
MPSARKMHVGIVSGPRGRAFVQPSGHNQPTTIVPRTRLPGVACPHCGDAIGSSYHAIRYHEDITCSARVVPVD